MLSWSETELLDALTQRLEYAKCKFDDVFECDREDFRKKVITLLRNGPRDLFAWIAMAGGDVTTRKIRMSDFESTRQALGQYSLGQITSAYGNSVKNVNQIMRFIFLKQKWESLDEVSARIIELRTNNVEFIELTKLNQLDYSSDYINFLLNAGTLQLNKAAKSSIRSRRNILLYWSEGTVSRFLCIQSCGPPFHRKLHVKFGDLFSMRSL